jgi:hypothetical protein
MSYSRSMNYCILYVSVPKGVGWGDPPSEQFLLLLKMYLYDPGLGQAACAFLLLLNLSLDYQELGCMRDSAILQRNCKS